VGCVIFTVLSRLVVLPRRPHNRPMLIEIDGSVVRVVWPSGLALRLLTGFTPVYAVWALHGRTLSAGPPAKC